MASNAGADGSALGAASGSQPLSANDQSEPEEEECSFSESESDFAYSDSDSSSETQQGARQSGAGPQACKFYNQGKCRDGKKCQYLHVCQYFLKGNCRYGSSCRLKHISNSGSESSGDERQSRRGSGRRRRRSPCEENEATDGRPYCWQLNSGQGWKNIANDHIIEAQYSRPSARGIKLYNTRFGVVSINFQKMKIHRKTGLQVRRWSSSQPGLATVWLWYCRRNHGWVQYGEKDSGGKAAPVKSARIEAEYQKNTRGSLKFTIDTTDLRINFREMCQENASNGRKRDVARRPQFRMPQGRVGNAATAFSNLHVSSPTWEFEGESGKWYQYKHRRGTNTESSVTSADIEAQYQSNPNGSINFTVSGQHYTLDFSAMTQTNLFTNKTRRVRRV
ncbi:hypothetical protein GJAV_G00161000 [Gymnothorax javanicus]|nr:hypothetical protein GJAV_G00161000 [Gymnothorax javanicus]